MGVESSNKAQVDACWAGRGRVRTSWARSMNGDGIEVGRYGLILGFILLLLFLLIESLLVRLQIFVENTKDVHLNQRNKKGEKRLVYAHT